MADEDKYDNFSDGLLHSVVDDIKKNKKETEAYNNKYIDAYRKVTKIKENKLSAFFKRTQKFTIHWKNMHSSFEDPDEIPKPKYLAIPVNIMILDDMMCDPKTFSNKRGSVLLNNLIKNLHYSWVCFRNRRI